jgi:hypothetical protein
MTTIFAENFRGFRNIEISLNESSFLVGDNSSGKTSILHLVDYVLATDLDGPPRLNEDMDVGQYDFFSPYFNYADVTIGYENIEEEKANYWKVITFDRKSESPPWVKSCTFARGKTVISAVSRKDGAKIRVTRLPEDATREGVMRLHRDHRGMKVVSLEPERQISLNSPLTLHSCLRSINPQYLNDADLLAALFIRAKESARHLGPLRGKAERFYRPDRRYEASGQHFAPMFRDVQGPKATELKEAIDKFGKDSKLFDHFTVEPVAKSVRESPLLVTVVRNEQKFLIHQVGVGVSQVAPIIVEAAFSIYSGKRNVLLIQQPELHLHPVAQAALGEFIYHINKNGIITICETHSDYMIDRYRSIVRDDATKRKSSVIYFGNDRAGNHLQRVSIATDGKLIEPPEDYFEFFINEFARTAF